jgi:hypothetical protein
MSLAASLADVVAGRRTPAQFTQDYDADPQATAFVAEALRRALTRQDWDAVDALLPTCVARPDTRFVAPLCEILDRQCLEISNSQVVAALAAAGDAAATPALTRAMSRTSPPGPDWAPQGSGGDEAALLRQHCAEAISLIASRADNAPAPA